MSDGVPVSGVSELVLEVVDLEAAERFYAGVLGLPVVERWPEREAIWVMAGAAACTCTSPCTSPRTTTTLRWR